MDNWLIANSYPFETSSLCILIACSFIDPIRDYVPWENSYC